MKPRTMRGLCAGDPDCRTFIIRKGASRIRLWRRLPRRMRQLWRKGLLVEVVRPFGKYLQSITIMRKERAIKEGLF